MELFPPSQGRTCDNGIRAVLLGGPVPAPSSSAHRSNRPTVNFAGVGLPLSFQHHIDDGRRDLADLDSDPRHLQPPDPWPDLDPPWQDSAIGALSGGRNLIPLQQLLSTIDPVGSEGDRRALDPIIAAGDRHGRIALGDFLISAIVLGDGDMDVSIHEQQIPSAAIDMVAANLFRTLANEIKEALEGSAAASKRPATFVFSDIEGSDVTAMIDALKNSINKMPKSKIPRPRSELTLFSNLDVAVLGPDPGLDHGQIQILTYDRRAQISTDPPPSSDSCNGPPPPQMDKRIKKSFTDYTPAGELLCWINSDEFPSFLFVSVAIAPPAQIASSTRVDLSLSQIGLDPVKIRVYTCRARDHPLIPPTDSAHGFSCEDPTRFAPKPASASFLSSASVGPPQFLCNPFILKLWRRNLIDRSHALFSLPHSAELGKLAALLSLELHRFFVPDLVHPIKIDPNLRFAGSKISESVPPPTADEGTTMADGGKKLAYMLKAGLIGDRTVSKSKI